MANNKELTIVNNALSLCREAPVENLGPGNPLVARIREIIRVLGDQLFAEEYSWNTAGFTRTVGSDGRLVVPIGDYLRVRMVDAVDSAICRPVPTTGEIVCIHRGTLSDVWVVGKVYSFVGVLNVDLDGLPQHAFDILNIQVAHQLALETMDAIPQVVLQQLELAKRAFRSVEVLTFGLSPLYQTNLTAAENAVVASVVTTCATISEEFAIEVTHNLREVILTTFYGMLRSTGACFFNQRIMTITPNAEGYIVLPLNTIIVEYNNNYQTGLHDYARVRIGLHSTYGKVLHAVYPPWNSGTDTFRNDVTVTTYQILPITELPPHVVDYLIAETVFGVCGRFGIKTVNHPIVSNTLMETRAKFKSAEQRSEGLNMKSWR